MQLKQIGKDIISVVGKAVGLEDENNPGTPEYANKIKDMQSAQIVLSEWNEGATVYSEIYNKAYQNRDFYLGEMSQQWNPLVAPEGELKLIFNLGATIIDLFTYMLSNQVPYMQFLPDDTSELSQLEANFGEEITRKVFRDAKFEKRFRDGVKTQFMLGFCWPILIWNPNNKEGSDKGTLEISILNGFHARAKYATNDYDRLESIITRKRMSITEVKRVYNFEAVPDTEDLYVPKDIQPIDDGKVSVFNRYDDKTIMTVINGRTVRTKVHNYGFVPATQVNNVFVPNDAHGHAESERWKTILQELNALLTSASEISRDLAYPPILEYNNALGGRKIPKWRGQKIPVRRSDKGEAVTYMITTAQIAPLLKQSELLIELFHFIALMPKAVGGIFPANVTSGFQAKLSMQSATLTTENRKIDWNIALTEMTKMALKILAIESPESLSVKLPNGKKFEFKNLDKHEIEILWPENLATDIAREVQNLILGIQNNITSVHQAIEKYNVLMGIGSPTDTIEFLKEESTDPTLNPQKVAQIEKIKQLESTMNQASDKLNQLNGAMGGGLPATVPPPTPGQNPNNMLMANGQPLPEEQRPTSQTETAGESVAPTSTGGVLPNGGAI